MNKRFYEAPCTEEFEIHFEDSILNVNSPGGGGGAGGGGTPDPFDEDEE